MPSPIGHGPIELDSNICLRLQRTLVTVAVVSLLRSCVVMVQTGCLVPLNETCRLQTILFLILTLCYCPIVSNSVGQGPIELDMVF